MSDDHPSLQTDCDQAVEALGVFVLGLAVLAIVAGAIVVHYFPVLRNAL